MKSLRPFCAAALIFASACSSHATNALIPNAGASGSSGPSKNAVASAKLSIVVPRKSTSPSSSARRRPLYVSPSSAQLNVAVNGGTPSTYGLTPSTPGCAIVLQNLTCVFTIAAAAGNDSFALTLTDGAGNVLSKNVVSATLAAGASTPVNVTLAGVPASVAIAPGPNAAIEGSATPAYHIPGFFGQPIELEALDADGNVIVGPGAPTFASPAVTVGGANATIAPAGGSDPNLYLLKGTGTAAGQTVTVSATAQGIPLNDGTTSTPVSGTQSFTFTPALAIVGGPTVNVLSLETGNTVAQLPICPGLCGATFATGATVDGSGNLYVAITQLAGLSQARKVQVYATGATVPTSSLSTSNGVTGATQLAVDKNNMLYVANAGTGFGFHHTQPSITEYAPGATTPTHQISGSSTGIGTPTGIAVDASGNVYESDADGYINVYGPGNQTAPAQTLSDPQLASPGAIALDASGGIYVGDQTNGYIAYFAPGSTAVTSTLSDPTFAPKPGDFIFDPSGNMWVSVQPSAVEEVSGSSLPGSISILRTLGPSGVLAWIP